MAGTEMAKTSKTATLLTLLTLSILLLAGWSMVRLFSNTNTQSKVTA